MSHFSLPRFLVAGTGSGSGKTTVTCGLLRAFQNKGLSLCAFKCGPDYIDPLFHSKVLGVPSRNLDLFFMNENQVVQSLQKSAGYQLAVMEGVMGYYDGLGGSTHQASAYHLAQVTQTPAVLVVPAKGASLSLAATVSGFLRFRQNSGIFGVILNGCSPSAYPLLKKVIEQEAGVPVLGFLPHREDLQLPSRHLGLTLPGEIEQLQEQLQALAQQCEKTIDLHRVLELAALAPPLFVQKPQQVKKSFSGKIAAARDEAFCFYYEDNLDFLREQGAEIAFFSPIQDQALPENSCGLILPGGYPELFARQLAKNQAMRSAIKQAVCNGLPTIAECGGFLYLLQQIQSAEGQQYPMAGVLGGSSEKGTRLGNFGYITLTAQEDSLLFQAGDKIQAHEFHYWQAQQSGAAFAAEKPVGGKSWVTGYAGASLYAGFPHLHFASHPDAARRFAAACAKYQAQRTEGNL